MYGNDMESFVLQICDSEGWPWRMEGSDYVIEVPTFGGRSQLVYVSQGMDPDGVPLMFFWSPVGPAQLAQRDPFWLLSYNTELSYGAFAIFNDMLVVKDSQIMQTADAEEIRRMIFYVAKTADEMEAQLMGTDQT